MTKTKIKTLLATSFPWADKHTMNDKLQIGENPAFEIKDFPLFIGKPLSEIKAYLEAHYADRLADLSLIEAAEAVMPKDGNYHLFFGSQLRSRGGSWFIPCSDWDGAEWSRRASWLDYAWHSSCRVVLLGISSSPDTLASPASLPLAEPLELRVEKLEEDMESLRKIISF